jgi:hypothetical protein
MPSQQRMEGLPSVGEKRLKRRPDEGNQRSQRSGRGDHGSGQKAWEHQRDEHCEPDAVTRRGGNERAARESAEHHHSQGER